MKTYLYFAYGSNLNVLQMAQRCPDSVGISSAVLSDYKLVERSYADIEVAPGKCVHGALYEISENDLKNLDRYEGFPDYYTRQEVTVIDNAGIARKAFVYMMTEEYTMGCYYGTYSENDRQVCSGGAEYWKIPNAFAKEKEG